MAAPVRIEAMAFSDPRYELLGQLAGYNAHEARGRMCLLWSVCTDRQTCVVADVTVRSCLGMAGVEALLGSDLGEKVPGGIRVKGTEGRIGWLGDRRAAAKAGGEAKRTQAEAKRKPKRSQTVAKPKPDGSHEVATDLPNGSPLTLTLSLPIATSTEKDLPPAAAGGSDHAAFIAEFTRLYAENNGGSKPTWGEKPGAMVKGLLSKHPLDECIKRMTNMFRAPPDFPGPPYDLGSLVLHFDKFAQPFKRAGGHFKVTGDEKYAGGEVEI